MRTKTTYIAVWNVGQYYNKEVVGTFGSNNLREFRSELRTRWNEGRDNNRFERGNCLNCEWSIKNTTTGETFSI
jgi:hypothetical protein